MNHIDTTKLRAYIPVEGQEGLAVRDKLMRQAADEIDLLRRDLEQWEARWRAIRWCAEGCGEDRPKTSREAASGPSIGGYGGVL